MKKIFIITNIFLLLSLILSACKPEISKVNTPSPTQSLQSESTEEEPTRVPQEDILYLNLTWHQHQPLYYKNEEGVYTRPWVRVHATKDYYDMAAILEQYPQVKLTINITPVLIKQLEDYSKNGAIDLYWQYALIPANELTIAQKEFILNRFFDANYDKIIARFPRYQELLDKRGGSSREDIQTAIGKFSVEDFRDLQVWFNLAWFDPDFLASEPLQSLVEKQRNFSEDDKQIVFSEALKIIDEVIPIHKKLQDNGQIEVITTPYAHPILPLLIDSSIAAIGNPSTDLPTKFSYPTDALTHLQKSVEIYQEEYDRTPRGLWPGEGAVAQLMVPFVIKAGYQWMATGEPVLAKSLGIGSFTRDAKETVKEADALYRPYYVKNQEGEKLAVFFRDGNLSDKIGFTYSGISGEGAAKDLMLRLENIRQQLKSEGSQGPHLVSIIVDGENAWEHYDNDAKAFFHALYKSLSESETIKTITPSEYLSLFPEQREIEDLFPGAWFSPNYDTWIGEPEENLAWEYLRQTREILAKYNVSKVRKTTKEALDLAEDYMYLAEGSDWFWWYGSDQDSGQDEYFDEGYRALLRNVFQTLGEPVPTFVEVPIIQAKSVSSDEPAQGLSTPIIDGIIEPGEWDKAGLFNGQPDSVFENVKYTQDEKNIYFLIPADLFTDTTNIQLYLKSPRGAFIGYPFIKDEQQYLLGIPATHMFQWNNEGFEYFSASDRGWDLQTNVHQLAMKVEVLEMSIPLAVFGEIETGDSILFILFDNNTHVRLPENGPGQVVVPDLGLSTVIMEVNDPEGDDFGPGSYTYPTDSVFPAKAFDLKTFRVSYDEKSIIFKIELFGPIPNPWGSPNNLAIQTLDIYIDTDPGKATGARKLLPGRNVSLSAENGWDYAIWAEGWTPQILSPDPVTLEPKEISTADYKIIVDPAGRSVTIRVAKELFGDSDPEKWGYAVVVLGQEGYPSSGVWRVRDVDEKPAQWRFGGGGNSTNHTRVIDLIWPDGKTPTQSEMLSAFTLSSLSTDQLTADDYAIIDLLRP